jgi:hypothetical protein
MTVLVSVFVLIKIKGSGVNFLEIGFQNTGTVHALVRVR